MEFKHLYDGDNGSCIVTHNNVEYRLRVDRQGKHSGHWFIGRPGKRIEVPVSIAVGEHAQLETHLRGLIERGEI